MFKYKHGEKVQSWKYKWAYVPNPHYNPHLQYSGGCSWQFYGPNRTDETIWAETTEKVAYGVPYKFRCDPLPYGGSYRNGGWTKYSANKGRGKAWKRSWHGANVDRMEVYNEYGITFKMPSRLDYKYCNDNPRSWKRTKKRCQWM